MDIKRKNYSSIVPTQTIRRFYFYVADLITGVNGSTKVNFTSTPVTMTQRLKPPKQEEQKTSFPLAIRIECMYLMLYRPRGPRHIGTPDLLQLNCYYKSFEETQRRSRTANTSIRSEVVFCFFSDWLLNHRSLQSVWSLTKGNYLWNHCKLQYLQLTLDQYLS